MSWMSSSVRSSRSVDRGSHRLIRPEDEGMDRIMADRPQADLDAAPKPAGNLFRCPTLSQEIDDEAAQRLVGSEDGRSLVTVPGRGLGEDRAVGIVGMGVASERAADRRDVGRLR